MFCHFRMYLVTQLYQKQYLVLMNRTFEINIISHVKTSKSILINLIYFYTKIGIYLYKHCS